MSLTEKLILDRQQVAKTLGIDLSVTLEKLKQAQINDKPSKLEKPLTSVNDLAVHLFNVMKKTMTQDEITFLMVCGQMTESMTDMGLTVK